MLRKIITGLKKSGIEDKDDEFQLMDDELKLENLPWSKQSNFSFCPLKRKEFWRPEAAELRKMFLMMLPAHIFLLIFCDFCVYQYAVLGILVDLVFIWLSFLNYMTLNKMFVII
jgi:hypothetical protein